MATPKAKKPRAPKAKTAAKPKAPQRTRPIQVIVRLSADEKRDLDEVVARWEAAADEQGFSGNGFADWLRAIIRREKRASGQ